MRVCSKCKIEKEVTEFHKHKNGKDGLKSRCKECNRLEANEFYHKNPESYKARSRSFGKTFSDAMKEWLTDIKVSGGCAVCGDTTLCILDFHHVDEGEKEKNIGNCIRKGLTFVEKELTKCVVLCANCHRKTHAGLVDVSGLTRCNSKFKRSPNRRMNLEHQPVPERQPSLM